MTTVQDEINGSETTPTVFLILTCILTASSISSTALRCFVRASQRRFSWDDWLILFIAVLLIVRTGLQIHRVQVYTRSLRSSVLSTTSAELLIEEEWITHVLAFPTICLLKCSCCVFLLRLNKKHKRRAVVWFMRIIMAGLIITNLEPAIVYLAECSPVKAYWISGIGTCWPDKVREASLYLQLVYSVLFDAIFTIIPLGIVYMSKLHIRDRITMCSLAAMGCLVTASAIVETSMINDIVRISPGQAFKPVIFANIELHVGIVAINVACMYHVYSTPRHGRRVSDATKRDEENRLNGDNISTHSDIEHQADLDDANSETDINPSSLYATYNTTTANYNTKHNKPTNITTVHTDTTNSTTVAGHAKPQNSPLFPSPRSLLRSLSKRKNLPPPTLLPPFASSSSPSQPSNHYQLHPYPYHHNHVDSDFHRATLNEVIAYDVTDTVPVQDSIRKVTEYVVVSNRISQASSVSPPGNGNWFIIGRVP